MKDRDSKIQPKDGLKKQQDDALWTEVTKDITPLEGKSTHHPKTPAKSKEKHPPRPPPTNKKTGTTTRTAPSADTAPKPGSHEMDLRTRRRLKRGQMAIDGRLDLHGMTQARAHQALLDYIPAAQEAGKRCILVITGKGQARHGDPSLLEQIETAGVLKQKTPEWLRTPPLAPYILEIQPARPNHGGEGALYVLLRRKR